MTKEEPVERLFTLEVPPKDASIKPQPSKIIKPNVSVGRRKKQTEVKEEPKEENQEKKKRELKRPNKREKFQQNQVVDGLFAFGLGSTGAKSSSSSGMRMSGSGGSSSGISTYIQKPTEFQSDFNTPSAPVNQDFDAIKVAEEDKPRDISSTGKAIEDLSLPLLKKRMLASEPTGFYLLQFPPKFFSSFSEPPKGTLNLDDTGKITITLHDQKNSSFELVSGVPIQSFSAPLQIDLENKTASLKAPLEGKIIALPSLDMNQISL